MDRLGGGGTGSFAQLDGEQMGDDCKKTEQVDLLEYSEVTTMSKITSTPSLGAF